MKYDKVGTIVWFIVVGGFMSWFALQPVETFTLKLVVVWVTFCALVVILAVRSK